MVQNHMSCEQADALLYYLESLSGVRSAKIYERTADAVILYQTDRKNIIQALKAFQYDTIEVPENILENSGRELNRQYQDKLMRKVAWRYIGKWILPYPVRTIYIGWKSLKYLKEGLNCLLHRKIEVPVLDATAIGVSILRNDFSTASSVMFMLGIGELLEEWTHKKSVDDLARAMSLNIHKVWKIVDGQEVLVSASDIHKEDKVVVHMGNMIPFDGIVEEGEAMVNQASLTGESIPVRKSAQSYVYAGTVLEEGELTISVKQTGSDSKFDKIVKMIEESEKLKSNAESKAAHIADSLVPYMFGATGLTYLFTRDITRTLSVLMVDFCCALKLSTPISVLSAIREANNYHVIVKGGKYLEAVAEADTIVFDKTGTLTKAKPTVVDVVSFCEEDPDELLRKAACIEEHFPHSMASAVLHAAEEKNLIHCEEMHSKVEYIVAHGISTQIDEKKTIIGSYHFVFEVENCVIPAGMEEKFASLPEEYSHLYMAMDGQLVAVICIEDPLREEARDLVHILKEIGIPNVVMMTGDSDKTAKAIAKKVGVDRYFSEVLPEDKAEFVEKEREAGHRVIMIGDGINDSPALSAADVGIAIGEGAEIAREIADITIEGDNLFELLVLKRISNLLIKRIHKNYRTIVGFNSSLILLGILGVIQPTTAALLHNASTLCISLNSMKNLLPDSTEWEQ
jgi:heavy metal translocating P-type ATPase